VGLAMEVVGIFCGHLVYFMAIWSILRPLGILYVYLACFTRFGMFSRLKSGIFSSQTLPLAKRRLKFFDITFLFRV
jgi:hypothetical protein